MNKWGNTAAIVSAFALVMVGCTDDIPKTSEAELPDFAN